VSEFQFDLCGDHLAVNFANTVSKRHTASPVEHLVDYPALVAFARQSGVIPLTRATKLLGWAAREPALARLLLDEALPLRDALYRLFAEIASQRRPDPRDLAELSRWAKKLDLGVDLKWHWAAGAQAPDALMGPIIEAALALVTTEQRHRIRICGADDCVWLFVDTSKNGTRRWCDMKACGNRMKARRFLARARASRARR
jgi:predicted RNA-binding Zn ribbon-like protein